MKTSESTVEILSPAGCYPSLQAAIDSGADAVYFGLAQLNMRARSRRSFHLEDLPKIMQRCRDGGIRGYLELIPKWRFLTGATKTRFSVFAEKWQIFAIFQQ